MQQLSEAIVINMLKDAFSSNQTKNTKTTGIGDDCAVISMNETHAMLITTDLLVENTHFIRKWSGPKALGYKLIAVNVSDIAAMGGEPTFGTLNFSLPNDMQVDWLGSLISSIKHACNQFNIEIVGGDTSVSNNISLSMTLMGTIEQLHVKYQNTAKDNDVICLTGKIGDSTAGLYCLSKSISNDYLINSHLYPKPHIEQGQWLARQNGVHAMTDVSDGLGADLNKILEHRNLGAIINVYNLPISNELIRLSKEYSFDQFEMAISGGEEYCLLFTANKKYLNDILQIYRETFGCGFHVIGHVTTSPKVAYMLDDIELKFILSNFDHFKDPLK